MYNNNGRVYILNPGLLCCVGLMNWGRAVVIVDNYGPTLALMNFMHQLLSNVKDFNMCTSTMRTGSHQPTLLYTGMSL